MSETIASYKTVTGTISKLHVFGTGVNSAAIELTIEPAGGLAMTLIVPGPPSSAENPSNPGAEPQVFAAMMALAAAARVLSANVTATYAEHSGSPIVVALTLGP